MVPEPQARPFRAEKLTRATNLPCAFTDFATCPLPPAGNHLAFGVEAGEKTPYERG
ncbi:uncharacterized protein DUF1684 [Lentzea flaviverrucosa]|uniref:DUF1684 domain-containing protein n=1 Tax=Lentzea flaviverrucosa TaxID=200379 RepID=A0A1H9XDL8_9PSEU|nr:uncharacterized protein DUF1684 [Lentzea flaviverrucosa]SES44286.1 hypothetical protein SAMN05216195_114190 [Lentzea flaviverrucosa]